MSKAISPRIEGDGTVEAPLMWALALDGEAGVGRMLGMLREELRIAMALSGCAGIGDIKPGAIASL